MVHKVGNKCSESPKEKESNKAIIKQSTLLNFYRQKETCIGDFDWML